MLRGISELLYVKSCEGDSFRTVSRFVPSPMEPPCRFTILSHGGMDHQLLNGRKGPPSSLSPESLPGGKLLGGGVGGEHWGLPRGRSEAVTNARGGETCDRTSQVFAVSSSPWCLFMCPTPTPWPSTSSTGGRGLRVIAAAEGR